MRALNCDATYVLLFRNIKESSGLQLITNRRS